MVILDLPGNDARSAEPNWKESQNQTTSSIGNVRIYTVYYSNKIKNCIMQVRRTVLTVTTYLPCQSVGTLAIFAFHRRSHKVKRHTPYPLVKDVCIGQCSVSGGEG